MTGKEHDTELRIMEAAVNVFTYKGFDGARMQEIADTAGINKALLHYYFRSKERLFDAVFKQVTSRIFPPILQILDEDLPFLEKIIRFVNTFIDILLANPQIPAFILHEINNNPSRFTGINQNQGIESLRISRQIQSEIHAGRIRATKPEHLLVNLLSICVFPFISRPLLKSLLQTDEPGFNLFLESRKSEIVNFFIQSIRIM
jgi:TetR/AcrR family transcriptional regulator